MLVLRIHCCEAAMGTTLRQSERDPRVHAAERGWCVGVLLLFAKSLRERERK